jgi:hypothetical protein
MRRKLQRYADKFPDEVGRALYIETEIESKEVKRRTPVDKGTLRASVHVVGPNREGRSIYTLIVAGGPAAPYAFWVHENLTAFHKVGQAKYIESVVMESRPFMGRRVAARIEMNRLNA